jgi:hypothetical protein
MDRESPNDADLANKSVLALWIRRTRINIDSHNAAERRYALAYEVSATLTLGGVVALGQIAIISPVSSAEAKFVVGIATASISVLSATSVIWDFRAKNLQHRAAARSYAILRRAMEELSQMDPVSPEAKWRRQEIRCAWDTAAAGAPNVLRKLRERARQRFEERYGRAGNELPDGYI